MPYTDAEVVSFLKEPPSNDIFRALLNAVETYGMLEGTMLYDDADFLEQLMLSRELRLINALSGKDYTYEDILARLSLKNDDDEIYRQVTSYNLSKEFIVCKLSLYKIIPAIDILRVNCFLRTHNQIVLSDTDFIDAYDDLAQAINNKILRVFYGLNSESHIFLRLAATHYLINMNISNYELDILTLDILFSTIIQNGQTPLQASIWLAKYKVLNVNWRFEAINESFETAIIDFLNYLKDEFYSASIILCNRRGKLDGITETLRQNIPKAYCNHLTDLLYNKICIRNSDFIDTLHVSPMTAIKYTKILEDNQLITGIKQGREKIYFNNVLISLIRE